MPNPTQPTLADSRTPTMPDILCRYCGKPTNRAVNGELHFGCVVFDEPDPQPVRAALDATQERAE